MFASVDLGVGHARTEHEATEAHKSLLPRLLQYQTSLQTFNKKNTLSVSLTVMFLL
jgi:hypothetical protein